MEEPCDAPVCCRLIGPELSDEVLIDLLLAPVAWGRRAAAPAVRPICSIQSVNNQVMTE